MRQGRKLFSTKKKNHDDHRALPERLPHPIEQQQQKAIKIPPPNGQQCWI